MLRKHNLKCKVMKVEQTESEKKYNVKVEELPSKSIFQCLLLRIGGGWRGSRGRVVETPGLTLSSSSDWEEEGEGERERRRGRKTVCLSRAKRSGVTKSRHSMWRDAAPPCWQAACPISLNRAGACGTTQQIVAPSIVARLKEPKV